MKALLVDSPTLLDLRWAIAATWVVEVTPEPQEREACAGRDSQPRWGQSPKRKEKKKQPGDILYTLRPKRTCKGEVREDELWLVGSVRPSIDHHHGTWEGG